MLTSKTVGEQNGVFKIQVHICTFFTENILNINFFIKISFFDNPSIQGALFRKLLAPNKYFYICMSPTDPSTPHSDLTKHLTHTPQ